MRLVRGQVLSLVVNRVGCPAGRVNSISATLLEGEGSRCSRGFAAKQAHVRARCVARCSAVKEFIRNSPDEEPLETSVGEDDQGIVETAAWVLLDSLVPSRTQRFVACPTLPP